MGTAQTVYVLGAGAIGFPLAAYLANAGRAVVAVRTSRSDVPKGTVTVTVQNGPQELHIPLEMVSLSQLDQIEGTIVVAAKAYANATIAAELVRKRASGPVVIMQNGVGVEQPFLDAQFPTIYRCVLYITSQTVVENRFTVRPVTASPIGAVVGDEAGLAHCVELLSTEGFPFRAEPHIQREVWKKAIANVAFNSICPLLDVDNGVFARDAAAADLARELVRECVTVTERLNLGLTEHELMEQIMLISRRSDGQLISTLQDIRAGRETEIASLNLEIARLAASLEPGLHLPRVDLLGQLIAVKAAQQRHRPA
jgi:2-dehydropantoate 2-reductase